MSDSACQKIIFITGAGHSGTTLLGMMLGTHADALFAGEMQESRFFDDMSRPAYKRTCRACGAACPIWNKETLAQTNLYDALTQASGRHTIIDSTKKPLSWVAQQSLNNTVHKALILLMRDPRAVVASNKRKFYKKTVLEHAQEWATQIDECESLTKVFSGPVLRVRYEELARKPEETLRSVCVAVGLPFHKRMLYPWDADHHPLRGNMGTQSIAFGNTHALIESRQAYYEHHPKAVVLDERWKMELTTSDEETIRDVAGPLFSLYTWQT